MTPRCGSSFKVGILTGRFLRPAADGPGAGGLKKTGFQVPAMAGSLENLPGWTPRFEPVSQGPSRGPISEIQAITTGGCFIGK